MKKYSINKGIGASVEFKGLKAQYLFYFAGGLLGNLILVMVMYMAGINNLICLTLGLGLSGYLVYKVFSLNKKYGQYGLMKLQARKYFPRYIISRKDVKGYLIQLQIT